MANKTYIISGREYSKEQLIVIGKDRYPKFRFIPRIVGIVLLFVGGLVCALFSIVPAVLNAAGVLDDPDFPAWVLIIPFAVFGGILLVGLILFICSFIKNSEQTYINYAIKYLTKLSLNNQNSGDGIEQPLSKRDQETLERYERLLKGGVITEEEFEKRKKELLGL